MQTMIGNLGFALTVAVALVPCPQRAAATAEPGVMRATQPRCGTRRATPKAP